MHNDSLDFVVKSIENSLLIEKNNIIYQKYQNFLDDALVNRINSEIDSLKRCKLQNQTALTRERADYDQKLLKELKIIFSHSSIKNNEFVNISQIILFVKPPHSFATSKLTGIF